MKLKKQDQRIIERIIPPPGAKVIGLVFDSPKEFSLCIIYDCIEEPI
jgi:hypothetical protein